MRVEVTAAASADIRETMRFFAAPSRKADEFSVTVHSALAHLKQWPYTGHRRRDLTQDDVCFWTEDAYLFVLKIENNILWIVAVLHSKRNVARLLRQRFSARKQS